MNKNYAAVDCTGVRQYGENQKGFFDLPVGNTVTLNMGFRVYDHAFATKARVHRDYKNVSFELLPKAKRVEPTRAISLASLAVTSSALALALLL